LEKADGLKGTRHSAPDDLVGFEAGQFDISELNRSPAARVNAGDQIEDGRFACAVGAD
jgi:hypothetical protein